MLLRAGEFGLKGVESAEVVLDAGEILNTLTGMDLVAIGYAVEKLPTAWSSFMKKLRVEEYLLNEGQNYDDNPKSGKPNHGCWKVFR